MIKSSCYFKNVFLKSLEKKTGCLVQTTCFEIVSLKLLHNKHSGNLRIIGIDGIKIGTCCDRRNVKL